MVQTFLKKDFSESIVFPLGKSDYQDFHLVLAIPLGFVCGIVASLGLIVQGISRTIRLRLTQAFAQPAVHHEHDPLSYQYYPLHGDLLTLLFPTLAGFINGLAAACISPYVLGSGTDMIKVLLDQAIHNSSASNGNPLDSYGVHTEGVGTLSTSSYLVLAVTKAVLFSMSLGLGCVGGPVIPTLLVGLSLGMAVSASSLAWPLSLTVPCCMVATTSAIVPTPFAWMGTVAVMFDLDMVQLGPVLVSTMIAFGITGGSGVLRSVAEKRLEIDNRATSEEGDAEHVPREALDQEDDVEDTDFFREF
jgi:H+/Cl- antiporter ClcA